MFHSDNGTADTEPRWCGNPVIYGPRGVGDMMVCILMWPLSSDRSEVTDRGGADRNLARAAAECVTCPLCRMAKGSRTKHVRREGGERPLQPWRYLTLALWRCIDKNELKIARSPTLGKSSTQRPRSYHIQSTIWAIFSISTISSTA